MLNMRLVRVRRTNKRMCVEHGEKGSDIYIFFSYSSFVFFLQHITN